MTFKPELTNEEYVSITEICRIFRISRTPLYRLIHEKKIRAVKVGNAFRVKVSDMREFIELGGSWNGGLYGSN